ncbi:glycosyltransferase family 2 protein [Vibrio metschnikovii]|nr:glycosyltransferase family 2 protein [Vibrio metschnikovii]EKO3899075.1 glycosyltransferase family 2 protein [Vibrio metschnikovii]
MKQKSFPLISVIIPTYHDWDRLQLCLDALKKQTYPREHFEIIVANNDPKDDIPLGFDVPENCVVLEESKPGSYAARNAALSIAKGEILAFTDSDCQPQEDWLLNAVSLFEEQPNVSRIGGRIRLIMGDTKQTIAEIYEKAYAFRQQDFIRDKGMAATGNMIARKSVFDSIGFFNHSLMSGGDAEWGMRAQSKNFEIVYSEDCVVWHPTRRQLSEIIQKTKREAGGHFKLMQSKSLVKKLFSILVGVLPPVKSIWRVFRDENIAINEFFIAVTIRYYLRLISTTEKIKIMLAFKKVERV